MADPVYLVHWFHYSSEASKWLNKGAEAGYRLTHMTGDENGVTYVMEKTNG